MVGREVIYANEREAIISVTRGDRFSNFEQAVARAEKKRDVLFSLLSPEQAQKKKEA